MDQEFTLTLVNRIEQLDIMAQCLQAFCTNNRLPKTVADSLEVVLHELASNVMSYAWDDGSVHELQLHVALANGKVVAEISDDGRPFDPLGHTFPDINAPLEERGIGGLGLLLARTIADTLEYRRDGERNRVLLSKAIPLNGGPA